MEKGIKRSGIIAVVLACVGSMAFGADLGVTPGVLSFSAYQDGAYPPPQTITVYNRTDTWVDWQITDVLPEWLSISPLSGTLDPNGLPGDEQQVVVAIWADGLGAGFYYYSFDVISGAERHTVEVKVDISC